LGERGVPYVAIRLPLLGRMHDPVGLVETLGGARLDVVCGLLTVVEARDVRGLEVDRRLAVGDPLGDGLADPWPLLDPHRRGRPEASHLRRLTEEWQSVR